MFDLDKIIEITKKMGIEIEEKSNAKHKIRDSNGNLIELDKETLEKIFLEFGNVDL